MSFPLKPFLHLLLKAPRKHEQNPFVDYNHGVKALYESLGPVVFIGYCFPIPKGLNNWNCQELAKILKVRPEEIFWTIIELHKEYTYAPE